MKRSQLPKLYIIPVISIDSPTIGIQDVGGSNGVNEEHLFLIRRLADWPESWDSIIVPDRRSLLDMSYHVKKTKHFAPSDVSTVDCSITYARIEKLVYIV